jgi:tRNA nucleotidyltransferase/poly(A) polymerase
MTADKKRLKLLIESIVNKVLNESVGQEPSKEQIDATLDLLKTVIQNTKFAGKTYIAGGAVRDMIMGKDPKDIDIVVELEQGGILFAEFLAKKLGIYKEGSNPVVYEKFGTAAVRFDGVVHNGVALDGVDIEAVNTREEEYEPGSRKPTTKHGTIKTDVFRRDLTINSLIMDLLSGEIVDLTGKGMEDIKQGVIRTPSEPDRIFQEDPLRLLRAARFAGRYGYTVPDYMRVSIKKNAPGLKIISAERIREELQKILMGANPAAGVELLFDLDLIPHSIPALGGHRQAAVAGAVHEGDFLTKMIMMLRNVAFKDVQGTVRQLKFSNDDGGAIATVVKGMQDIEKDPTSSNILKIGTGMYKSGYGSYIHLLEPVDGKVGKLKDYFNNGPVIHWSSNELMSTLGLKPGPILGKLTALQKNAWYKNPNISKEEMGEIIRKAL